MFLCNSTEEASLQFFIALKGLYINRSLRRKQTLHLNTVALPFLFILLDAAKVNANGSLVAFNATGLYQYIKQRHINQDGAEFLIPDIEKEKKDIYNAREKTGQ
jgi:hypothetical protein